MSPPPPGKRPEASRTEMTEYVLPTHANALGNVFGGQILAWMDLCAAICAQRHAGRIAITAGIDDLCFERPIRVGQVVRLVAVVTACFRTSMEIHVDVHGEDPTTGDVWRCVSAFISFVAIDEALRPTSVPPLILESDAERALAEAARARRDARLGRRRPA